MPQQKTAEHLRLRRDIAIASVLWATTFVVSKQDWAQHPGSLALRLVVVLMGIGGFIPVVYVYVRSIRLQDEFSQRIHLIALSITFATLAALSYSVDLLHQASFIPPVPAEGLWALMVIMWFIAMVVTSRSYR